MELSERVALITGGASGIGRASALAMAAAGADVVIADVSTARARAVAHEIQAIGRTALVVRCDVTSEPEMQAAAEEALSRLGHVDVLMNNAGVVLVGPPERIPVADWTWILDINLLGVVRGLRAFLPHMMDRGSGWVVNTASSVSFAPNGTFNIPYTVSKFAVRGLTESLALYLRPHGIGVTCLCPNLVSTNLGENVRVAGTDETGLGGKPDLREVSAETVGALVVRAIQEERSLVLTHPEDRDVIRHLTGEIEKALVASSG